MDEYSCKIIQRYFSTVETDQTVNGKVYFVPVRRDEDVWRTQIDGVDVTVPVGIVSATIRNGWLNKDGQNYVRLFAGGTKSNPSTIRWRIEYQEMEFGGVPQTVKGFEFDVAPGETFILGMIRL